MDRVYEAYMGGMGKSFAEKTQKRIRWICSKVEGGQVLDVGCSQGISAILLAREGKHVTGLDISGEAIAYAQNRLSEEETDVQTRVTFSQADFACVSLEKYYDTVIMGEVLEHLSNPETFITNAWKHLRDEGVLVVTVPFGINDDPDHKQTFYYWNLRQILEQHFCVTETIFFGKWIGFVARKIVNLTEKNPPTYAECLQVEQAFYKVEREAIDQLSEEKKAHLQAAETYKDAISKLKESDRMLREKLKKTEENYLICKDWLNSKDKMLEQVVREKETVTAEMERINTEKAALMKQMNVLRNALLQSDAALEAEEKFLRDARKEIDLMEKQLRETRWKSKRYDAFRDKLYGTWYGKLVLVPLRLIRKVKRLFAKK